MENGGAGEWGDGRGSTGHALWRAPTSVDLGEEEGKGRNQISKTFITKEKGGKKEKGRRRRGGRGRRGEEGRVLSCEIIVKIGKNLP